jgi:hypothetical protein
MKNTSRLLVVILVLISGIALSPILAVKSAGVFHWQAFASAYRSPYITADCKYGKPGSTIGVIGTDFLPNVINKASVNGHEITLPETDGSGNLYFVLTTVNADSGYYSLRVEDSLGTAMAHFVIHPDAPLCTTTNPAGKIALPAGIAGKPVFLPLIKR